MTPDDRPGHRAHGSTPSKREPVELEPLGSGEDSDDDPPLATPRLGGGASYHEDDTDTSDFR